MTFLETMTDKKIEYVRDYVFLYLGVPARIVELTKVQVEDTVKKSIRQLIHLDKIWSNEKLFDRVKELSLGYATVMLGRKRNNLSLIKEGNIQIRYIQKEIANG